MLRLSSVAVLERCRIHSLGSNWTNTLPLHHLRKVNICRPRLCLLPRFFASNSRGRRRGGRPGKGQQPPTVVSSASPSPSHKNHPTTTSQNTTAIPNTAAATATKRTMSHSQRVADFLRQWVVPVRYRHPSTTTANTKISNQHMNKNSSSNSSNRNSNTGNNFYTREQGYLLLLYRLPMWAVGMAMFLAWDDGVAGNSSANNNTNFNPTCFTAPLSLIRIRGPSMLPTMAADGSDIWLCRRTPCFRLLDWWSRLVSQSATTSSFYQRGDLVGFSHPDYASHISCKRIVGLPGDAVQRYGQYPQYYSKNGIGLVVEEEETNRKNGFSAPLLQQQQQHSWMDPTCPWDISSRSSSSGNQSTTTKPTPNRSSNSSIDDLAQQESLYRTLTVPPGHVWVEADCPALGIDSRHAGPIPMEWIRGKLVARLWPLHSFSSSSRGQHSRSWRTRPIPIPLDPETLLELNVYRQNRP